MSDDPVRDGANDALDALVNAHRKAIAKHGVDEAEQLLVKTLFIRNRNNVHEVLAQLVGRYALLMTRVATQEKIES